MMRLTLILLLSLFFSCTLAQQSLKLAREGRYSAAEEVALKEITAFRAENENSGFTLTLNALGDRTLSFHSLGLVYKARGNFAKSESWFKRADSAYHTYSEAVNLAWKKYTLGTPVIDLRGRVKKYDRMTEMSYARQIEMARMAMVLGEMNRALTLLDSTYALMVKKFNKSSSLSKAIYPGYSEYFALKSQYDSSKSYYEKYIIEVYSDPNYFDESIKSLSDAFAGLSKCYLELGEPEKGIIAAKKAVKYAKHRFTKRYDGENLFGKIASLNQLGESYRTNLEYEKALNANSQALTIYNSKIGFIGPEKLPVLSTRAQIYWALSDTLNANKCFREMIEIYYRYTQDNFSFLSEHERASFYRNSKQYLELAKGYYCYLYFTKGYEDRYIAQRLYEININNKGALLNSSSQLLNALFAKGDSVLIGKYNEIRRLREELVLDVNRNDSKRGDALKIQIADLERSIRSSLSIEPEKYLSTKDIMNAIGDDATLVDILKCKVYDVSGSKLVDTGKSQYTYFIFNPNSELKLVRNELPSEQLEGRLYKGYLNFAKSDLRQPDIYDGYLKPIMPYLARKKVIIAGDAVYNLINPKILYDGSSFLVDKIDFVSVISARDLLPSEEGDKGLIRNVTLIGRPDYSTHTLKYNRAPRDLPGTEREVRGISKMVPQSVEQSILLGDAANEARIKKLQSASILHFATHGFFDTSPDKDPMYTSGLLLAIDEPTANEEDGYLTAYEAANLELKETFLVVLSACETGQGTFEEGEGVWGLQRAFQAAGVKYLIMSLFTVDDAITSLLMQHFYSNLFAGNDVRTAFNSAQNEIRQKFDKPVEWGAFVLKGI